MTTDHINFTQDRKLKLEELNDLYAKVNIGGIVFISIMMVIGVIGNAHVLYIYAFKFKPSNHRVYILCMASMDMVMCSVGMPFVIFDLRNPVMFEAVVICKSLRFLNYFMGIGSMLTLMVMATDRYKSICRPFGKQMTTQTAKIACFIALTISIFLSWPAPVLYGHSTVDAHSMTSLFKVDSNLTGTRCYTEDSFKETKYQLYFNALLLVIFMFSFCLLSVMYTLIARTIYKTSAALASDSETSGESMKISAITGVHHHGKPKNQDTFSEKIVHGSVELTSYNKFDRKETLHHTVREQDHQTKLKHIRENQSKNITVILAIITIVFLASYIPHLSLKIVAMLNIKFFQQLSYIEYFLYNTFVWTFFISNMANPIIYGFCLSKFRRKLYMLYGCKGHIKKYWSRQTYTDHADHE